MSGVPRVAPRSVGSSELPPGLMQCRRCRQWFNVYDGPHAPNCPAALGTMSPLPKWLPPLPPVRRVSGRKVA